MRQFIFKCTVFIGLFLITVNLVSAANSSLSIEEGDFVAFDESEIYDSFSEIDELTKYVEVNENITYSDLESTDFSLAQLSSNSAIALFPDEEDNRFSFNNQTAYFMGCAFGMLGILAVAIVNNGNSSVVNSSIWGCVTSGCVSAGGVIAFYVFYFAAFSGWYY